MSRVTRSAFSSRSPIGLGQVGDFQRDRLAIDQAHAFDLRHDLAFGHLQTLGDELVGGMNLKLRRRLITS